MVSIDDVRRLAMALPEVEETDHLRFHLPVWKVRRRTFLGIGRGSDTVVACVAEPEAMELAAAAPEICHPVRRQDARRSFLGVEVPLAAVAEDCLRDLIERAWHAQAPKRLARQHER